MAERAFTLTEASVRKLKADHDRLARIVQELQRKEAMRERPVSAIACLVGKAAAEIPEFAEETGPGSGEVQIWRCRNDIWEDAGYTETAYNFSLAAVAADVFLILLRHEQSAKRLVIFEPCGP